MAGIITVIEKIAIKLYKRTIRPLLPKKEKNVTYNGVASTVKDACKYDKTVEALIPSYNYPYFKQDVPDYENAAIRSIKKHVRKGDDVVVVGGGFGVTAVVAAKVTGEKGHVTVFEGGIKCIERIQDTIRLNNVADRVEVKHAVVEKAKKLRSEGGTFNQMSTQDLPPCDILELDCEGAEKDILSNLSYYPRVIIVEAHGNLGAPSRKIEEMAVNIGYDVVMKESVVEEKKIWQLTLKKKSIKNG